MPTNTTPMPDRTMPTETITPDPIASPLAGLRGTIRTYTWADGLLTAGLLLVAWFWLGLAFDYGLFRLTGFDWVLDAPRWVRTVALLTLAVVLLAVLVTRLAVKLTREFSDASLALVLEKRFPDRLQDKLITAVELADVDRAERHGYSADMVRATIAEARERVAGLPVDDVFNWRRLRLKGVAVAVTAFGTMLAVYTGYLLWTGGSKGKFAGELADVSVVWAERNLLLANVPWPRRAHVELIDFPGDELRIGKDAPAPRITAKAYQWVIADRGQPFGWRPLMWADVTKDLLGVSPPPATDRASQMDADTFEATYGANPDVRKVFDRLDVLAGKRSMSRTLRKLTVPAETTLAYAGGKTRGSLSLTPEPGNRYSGEVAGLKESVRFTVRGEDFVTRPRTITLVPPPMLVRFTQTESAPAYLYHPPAVGQEFSSLKGLRQLYAEKDLSLTGDKTTHVVRSGTGLVLRGQSDKPLSKVQVRPKLGVLPGLPAGETKPLDLKPEGDARDRFTFTFDRLTATVEFEFVLVDDDNVTAVRSVVLQVTEDQPPQVEMAVDVLRKSGNAYLVTPAARVPFLPDSKVRDDTGLSKVEFVVGYTPVESSFFLGVQAQYLTGVFAPAPLIPGWPSLLVPAGNAGLAQKLIRTDRQTTLRVPVARFVEALRSVGQDTPDLLAKKLTQPADPSAARVVKEVKFPNPDLDAFDLREAVPSLASSDQSGTQQRYRVELNVVAADANVETGPKTGQNLDPIRLLVVSEADLLMEISKDEEALIAKIDEALRKLRDAQTKLTQTVDRLTGLNPAADAVLSAAVRAQDIAQDVGKARDITGGVHTEYRRLYREAEVNRCSETLLRRYQSEIIVPIQAVLDGPFAAAEQAHSPFTAALAEGRKPDADTIAADRAALAELIRQMAAVREKLGEVLSLSKLRDTAVQIVTRQKQLGELLRRLAKDEVEKLGKPVIAAVPPLELNKGEKRVVKHRLVWGTFSGDEYRVRFDVKPAGTVKVPAEIRVPDDKDEVEYEVVAGDQTGRGVIVLTPSAGSPVELQVSVK